jgi:Asp-tRNA(Asn)/Glu-tRNA(Gln) amidotransferase A subunit family amidase
MNGSLGPMARSVTDLAKVLDAIVGYDPADPSTAHGVGRHPKSFAAGLDAGALKGARLGILREPFGLFSEPDSADFALVTEAFDKAVAELRAAGAEIVDPVVIPDLRPLLAQRAFSAKERAENFQVYFGSTKTAPFKSRDEILASPLFPKLMQRTRDRWTGVTPEEKYYASLKARDVLMTNMLKTMADHRLDAIVHKAVEHSPTLIKDGINPPYVEQKGSPHINTYLQSVPSIVVPAPFTRENLPTGITFLGRPYTDKLMIDLAYAYEQATHHRRIPPHAG